MPKPVITTIPPTSFFGPAVEAAENRRTAAIAARDDAQETVRALLAGGSRFHPLVIGSEDKPSDAEKAAIAADDLLMDAALSAGEDLASVGTPNRDAYRRELATAEATVRATERALADAESQLVEALKTERDLAEANTATVIVESHAAHLAAIDAVDATKRQLLQAEAVSRFLDQLEDEPIERLSYITSGTAGDRPVIGRNFVTVSFDAMVATMRAEADALLPAPEPDTDQDDSEPATFTREFRAAGQGATHDTPPAPHRDNRFNMDAPTRRRRASRASRP